MLKYFRFFEFDQKLGYVTQFMQCVQKHFSIFLIINILFLLRNFLIDFFEKKIMLKILSPEKRMPIIITQFSGGQFLL